jgi:dynein light intermediate chain 1
VKIYDENPRVARRFPQSCGPLGTADLVGPLGSSTLSLPAVDCALAEMEGGGGGGGGGKRMGGGISSPTGQTQHEVL